MSWSSAIRPIALAGLLVGAAAAGPMLALVFVQLPLAALLREMASHWLGLPLP